MENQIICPKCKTTISNHPVIESAVKGEDLGDTFIVCDCGETITYWAITAQLRNQKKPVAKLRKWLSGLFQK